MLYLTVMRHTAAILMPESWTLSDHLQSMACDGAIVLDPAMLVFRLAIPVCKRKACNAICTAACTGSSCQSRDRRVLQRLQSHKSRPEIHQLAAMHTWRCISIWRLLKA